MIYAFTAKATDSGPVVGIDGKPEFSVYRFGNEEAYQKALDSRWTGRDGQNLVKTTWQAVVKYFGSELIWSGGCGYEPTEWLKLHLDGNSPKPDDAKSFAIANEAVRSFNED